MLPVYVRTGETIKWCRIFITALCSWCLSIHRERAMVVANGRVSTWKITQGNTKKIYMTGRENIIFCKSHSLYSLDQSVFCPYNKMSESFIYLQKVYNLINDQLNLWSVSARITPVQCSLENIIYEFWFRHWRHRLAKSWTITELILFL